MSVGPLRFEAVLKERPWGGRRLERLGYALVGDDPIGEAWTLVDREDEQSVVTGGPLDGTTLHDLWAGRRAEVFGARGVASGHERFPILVKLLDATDTLSVQVHPPASVAPQLGGEPKTEMWVLLPGSTPDAHLFLGLRAGVSREDFGAALDAGEDVSGMLHRVDVAPGDVAFLPSGRVHAIGAGCLIAEIQQSSDTTYRVFDFNRPGLDGQLRELHVPESLRSIDFDDVEPALVEPDGESLVCNDLFEVGRLTVDAAGRRGAPDGEWALVCAVDGDLRIGEDLVVGPGAFVGLPASEPLHLSAAGDGPVEVLRVLLPAAG